MTKKEIQKGRRTHARQYDNNKPTDLGNYTHTHVALLLLFIFYLTVVNTTVSGNLILFFN